MQKNMDFGQKDEIIGLLSAKQAKRTLEMRKI